MKPLLFLGIPYDILLEEAWAKTPLPLRDFLLSGTDYLEEITCTSGRFIGKRCPALSSLTHLAHVEAHVRSLIHRLAPTYPLSSHPPKLLAYSPLSL